MNECHWMWTGDHPWDVDITKPPHNCPFPQECIPPEEDGAFIGEQKSNECREDP